jgi:hypothetical protein
MTNCYLIGTRDLVVLVVVLRNVRFEIQHYESNKVLIGNKDRCSDDVMVELST